MKLLSGKWMELEVIMLSKISQTQKEKYTFSLICRIQILKKTDTNMKRGTLRAEPAGGRRGKEE
jgi:hypothetical protein